MNNLDLFYRAFTEYKKHTKANVECVRFQRVSQSLKKSENESLTAVISTCTIDEDWIEAIERGIPYILKAIKEERQFIKTDGEVTPIEKVRKTSKDSIQDLARHSNYISREAPEGISAEILPDKVLIVQKENDYTVYENRVVYALLSYLQDFISMRLNKIKELANKYEASSIINKSLLVNNRKLDFEMKLNEVIKDDPIAMRNNKYQELITRIETIFSDVISLIKMPLMVECSKVELVSRPITKTNVLRMNTNFKECLSLFDFIAEYDKPGYTINVIEKKFNPLALPITFDYTEIILLSSFITYLHVNGITDELKANYELENKRLKQAEEDKILAKVKRIDARAKKDGKTLEEYLLILDEANKILTERNEQLLEEMERQKSIHEEEIKNLNDEHQAKVEEITSSYENQIVEINDAHEQQVNELNTQHEEEITNLNNQHEQEITSLNETHEQEINDINSRNSEEISQLRQDYDSQIATLQAELAAKVNEIETTHRECESLINKNTSEYESLTKELNSETERIRKECKEAQDKAEAELLAIRLKDGIKVDPSTLTSEERFNQLEIEKKYLDQLFKDAWKATKKKIRKEVMSEKPGKLFSKSKDESKQIDSKTSQEQEKQDEKEEPSK